MDGILLFNKPILWTSHDAVDFVRRRIGQKSVGHTGTLDPLATGLLVLLLGRATKLSQRLSDLDKDYYGTLTLGVITDTQDLEGRFLEAGSWEEVSQRRIDSAFLEFTGRQLQTTPAYSAARQSGRRMYEWARRGLYVETARREVYISQFQALNFSPPDVHFFLSCSKGTYARSLCDEVGKVLGCGAVLSSLVRTRVGQFRLEKALGEKDLLKMSLEEINNNVISRSPEATEKFRGC